MNQASISAIPRELTIRHQWVVWRSEERDGRQTKVPYSPRRRDTLASSTNPRTWSDFETALEILKRDRYDGVGYVFSDHDPFCGIDLDGAIAPDGQLEPWAEAILDRLDSYTELSPSGRGLHVICRAALPGGGTHKADVGMFDRARYFTMTGAMWPDSRRSVMDRQQQVDALYHEVNPPDTQPVERHDPREPIDITDQALLQRARSAANGADFQRHR